MERRVGSCVPCGRLDTPWTSVNALITRRSEVQILPPPLGNPGQSHFSSVGFYRRRGAFYGVEVGRSDQPGEDPSASGLHARKQVLVGGHREAGRGMAEAVAHNLDRDPLFPKSEACVCLRS